MLFDLLWLDGHSTCELPYPERRALLERLALTGPAWQTPPATVGNGEAVLASATELGLEGVVAKRLDSTYQPGRRSDAWRKVKVVAGQELVVGGWLDGQRPPRRAGSDRCSSATTTTTAASAVRGPRRLRHRRGPRAATSRRCSSRSRATPARSRHAPKLPSPHWVEPELVVEVAFHEWTSAGILRAPRFKGVRDRQAGGRGRPRDLIQTADSRRAR